MEYFSATLTNGIRLVHYFVDSPVAHCGVIINTGSRDEAPVEQGMAHFIEHTIFKGTKKRKAYHVISRMEDVGGEMNAYTSKEDTAIHASFLCEYYERALELFGDILINSTFPEKELKKEKEVIIDEINSYNDTPSELIFDEFEELIYDGHPMGRNILGTPELVRSFDSEDLRRFFAQNYNTDQMVICSVGKIQPKKILHLAQRYFSHLPSNIRLHHRKKYSGYNPVNREIVKDTYQAHCIIGSEAIDVFHDDRLGLVLLNNILGGQSGNSRLNLTLRERNGIAYNIESSYTAYSDTGTFTIYFGTDKENLERAIALIYREINTLQTKSLGAIQLSKAKKQLIGQLAMSQENHEDLMLAIGKSFLFFNKIEGFEEIYRKIEAITTTQLMEIANRVLEPKNLSVLIYK
jgi:predicted Zn-dependent peptidase